jgi:hypothetical protein
MRSHIARAACYGLGVVALVLATQSQAFAGAQIQTPEIDASTLSSGFGLLAAGLLIIRSRSRSK